MTTPMPSLRTLALLVLAAIVSVSHAADPQAKEQNKDKAKEEGKDAGFPDLVGALKATQGCLGVETAQTGSGKMVIFAWFEDKKAALNWYYSDTHQALVKRFFPGAKGDRKPMADVADDSGPIMAIASITMSEK